MLSSKEVEHIQRLLYTVERKGEYLCDIWFSEDMRLVVMFHVSDKDFTKGYDDQWPTYVCYSHLMMMAMWSPQQRARKICNSVNILICPTLYARLPCDGDSWCNERGGAALLDKRDWSVTDAVFYCYKTSVEGFLRRHGFFCMRDKVRMCGSQLRNAVIGSTYANTGKISGSAYFDHLVKIRSGIDLAQQITNSIISVYKQFKDYTDWARPIYLAENYSIVYVPMRISGMWKFIMQNVFGTQKPQVADTISENVMLFQEYSHAELVNLCSAKMFVPMSRSRAHKIYKKNYYEQLGSAMLQNLIETVDE